MWVGVFNLTPPSERRPSSPRDKPDPNEHGLDTTTSEDALEAYGPTPSICIDLVRVMDPYGLVIYEGYCATSLATHSGESPTFQLD